MPYLLPENALTSEFICKRVFIPDLPEYRTAVLGTLDYLAKWIAWERGGNNKGKIAADLFKIANDMTHEAWPDGCGDTMDCEQLKDCIREVLDEMELNVNVTTNCACGDCGSGTSLYCIDGDGNPTITPFPPTGDPPGTIPLPPGMTEPPVIDIPEDPGGEDLPPDGFGSWDEYDEDACIAANALVEYLYQVLLRFEELMVDDIANAAAVFVVLANVLTQGLWTLFTSEILYNIATFTMSVQQILDIPGQWFAAAAAYVDENRQDLVCALYSQRGNVGDWETVLLGNLFEATASSIANVTEQNAITQLINMLLPPTMGLSMLYDVVTYTGSFVGVDCADCEDDAPEGYVWITPTIAEMSTIDGTGQIGSKPSNGTMVGTSTGTSTGKTGIEAYVLTDSILSNHPEIDAVSLCEWTITFLYQATQRVPTPAGGSLGGVRYPPTVDGVKVAYYAANVASEILDLANSYPDHGSWPARYAVNSGVSLLQARCWTQTFNMVAGQAVWNVTYNVRVLGRLV